jgi:hypothetical protein
MAKRARRETTIDLRPAIEHLGLGEILRQAGEDAVAKYFESYIERGGIKKLIKRVGIDGILTNLSAEDRRELKRRLQ